ncbi:unnamed protein product [Sphagnum balticum]
MDIEGRGWPILESWLKDPQMAEIVDKLFVEIHYNHSSSSMSEFKWNSLYMALQYTHMYVQALSIAEIIAHTKQQPPAKADIFQSSLIRWDIRYRRTIRKYDTGIRYGNLKTFQLFGSVGTDRCRSFTGFRGSPASDRGLLWRVTAAVAAAAIAAVESSLGSLRKREGLERRSGGEAVKTKRRRNVGS